ncbi:MAG: response regulator [Desulfobacter sp.]|nr:MAG: response regulator [Desulfobacter sp.]
MGSYDSHGRCILEKPPLERTTPRPAFGIFAKVLTGLVLIVIVAVCSLGVTRHYFTTFGTAFQKIPQTHLPLFITASDLVKGTGKMIRNVPDIVTAQSPFVLEILKNEIEQEYRNNIALIIQMEQTQMEGIHNLPDKLKQFFAHFQSLIALAEKNIEVSRRIVQISIHLRRVSEELTVTGSPARRDCEYQWKTLVQIFSLLQAVPNIPTQQQLEEYKTQISQLEQALEEMCPMASRPPDLNRYGTTIRRYGTGEKGLFTLAEARIRLEDAIRKNLIENKFLSDKLVAHTDEIFNKVSYNVQAKSAEVVNDIGSLDTLFAVTLIAITLSAVLIFLFIRKSVIGRILALEHCMQQQVKGNPFPVPSEGRDEISSMAKSVSFFIEKRKEYETNLEQAKESAEKANQAKSIFLSNMSHELRTPLNGILGYAQILKKTRLTAEQKNGLGIIHDSGQHLLTLINDVLDLAKVEAGKMELCPSEVNLQDLLSEVVGMMRMTAMEKDIHLAFTPDPRLPARVLIDEKRLRQVLLNLLANAIKFTRRGKVTFAVDVVDTDRHSPGTSRTAAIRFDIRDTGTGMQKEEIEQIFEPFEQVGGRKERSGGTGLGLTITRNLVRLMGSEIHVKSKYGKGSSFSFVLNVSAAINAPVQTLRGGRRITGYRGRRYTMLVVDDRPENLSVLRDMLTPAGFEVIPAENGKEGFEKAQNLHPDAIFTDIAMPVMTGYEMLEKIRNIPETRDIPVFMVSAHAFDSEREKSRTMGCQGFLPKPVDQDTLFSLISDHLGPQWIYEETATGKPESEDPADLVPPPLEILNALNEWAMTGNHIRLQEKAEALEQMDDKYIPFARKLKALNESYDADAITALVDKMMKKERKKGG